MVETHPCHGRQIHRIFVRSVEAVSRRKNWFSCGRRKFTRLGFTESRGFHHRENMSGLEPLESRTMLAVTPAGFAETTYSTGLSMPTDMAFAPDGRLFVTQKMGDVRVIDTNGQLLDTPFLTVAADAQGHHGLLSLAFDPNFETNGYLYVFYTVAEGDPAVRLSRFTVSNSDKNVADPNSEVVMMEDIVTPVDIHDGGGMKFGNDGMLYLGIGDGGVPDAAQDMTSLLGKMLRLDVSNYPNIIPADNPYVGVEGVRDEIYAAGVRNPFKLDIDLETDRIFFTNTGTNPIEEVNELVAGGNYGFPIYEGPSGDPDFDDPVHYYEHGEIGGAISGATFYRGNSFPEEYAGDFFFADFSRMAISRIDLSGEAGELGELTSDFFITQIPGPVDIEDGPDGALYFLDIWTGQVSRVDYVGDANRNPEAVATADVNSGGSPLTVNFDGSTSSDPDGEGLFYSWDFGDGFPPQPGQAVQHTYNSPGIYFATLTVFDESGGSNVSEPVMIAVGETAPEGQINIVAEHAQYHGGDTINFSGTATDVEDGVLDPSSFSWKVEFINEGEVFPFMGPIEGVSNGSFVIPTNGETSTEVSYRITLTVTDSVGLTHTSSVEVLPQVTQITLNSSPGSLDVTLDGTNHSGEVSFDAVVGVEYPLESPPLLQYENGTTFLFESWSDGGGIDHTVVATVAPAVYTAVYQPVKADRVTASYFVAGLFETLLGRTADTASLLFHVDRLMAGDPAEAVIESFWQSEEHRALQVYEAYAEVLERIPAADELANWVTQLTSGTSENEMTMSLLTSSEFISLLKNIPSVYSSEMYRLILHREGTPEEVQFWAGQLENGVPHADVANTFLNSPERYNVLLDRYYNDFLGRPLEPSEAEGDLFAASSLPVQSVGVKVLDSSEFLTYQSARPVVTALYDNVLLRTASDAEIDGWVEALLSGVTRETVATAFHQSAEGLGRFVTNAYGSILDRSATQSEVDYWVNQMLGGMSERDVQKVFFVSGEYQELHPADNDFISSVYSKALGRDVTPSELASWETSLQSGSTREDVVNSLFSSTEYREHVIAGVYAEFLQRDPTAAETEYWVNTLPIDGTEAAMMRTLALSSDEYYRTAEVRVVFATELKNQTFVAALYNDVLQRSASQFEVDLWTTALASGVSRFTVAGQIWDSVEHATLIANQLYADLLDRAPTAQEVTDITTLLGSGGQSVDAAYSLLTSVEYSTLHSSNAAFVEALYADVLSRVASPLEAQLWTDDLDGGLSRSDAAAVFLNSVEARSNLVDATFNNYLGEDPEAEVVDTWLTLFSGGQTERDLALSILGGVDYYEQQNP